MKKGTKPTEVLLVTLLATVLGACAPEATAPEGGAAINRLVPVAVPDVWCAAASDAGQDSTAAKDRSRPRATCNAPKPSASGRGSLTWVVDSTLAAPDTTK